jgi:hypothetical protein
MTCFHFVTGPWELTVRAEEDCIEVDRVNIAELLKNAKGDFFALYS